MLEGQASSSAPYRANPKLSITRIGTRAYYRALEAVATQARLDLNQAEDARKFSMDGGDAALQKLNAYSQRLQTALLQHAGQPASLTQQASCRPNQAFYLSRFAASVQSYSSW